MVVQDCVDADNVFETIEICGYLGAKNEHAYVYMEQCKAKSLFSKSDERCFPEMSYCNYFWFWLPYRLGNGSEDDLTYGIRY
jgi:hypothetical protein